MYLAWLTKTAYSTVHAPTRVRMAHQGGWGLITEIPVVIPPASFYYASVQFWHDFTVGSSEGVIILCKGYQFLSELSDILDDAAGDPGVMDVHITRIHCETALVQ